MVGMRVRTLRGQLVLRYLSVLAILLLGLGIFQSITLTDYLRSSTAASMRQAAFAGIRALGPCFITSSSDLNTEALYLARILGSRDTAVKIVTPSGQALADHSMGPIGASRPLILSASTIHLLIDAAQPPATVQPGTDTSQSCQASDVTSRRRSLFRGNQNHAALSEGDLVLAAVPLGPYPRVLGFALLGRSFSDANATISRTEIVFALGALAALVLAALVALPLINRALKPLHHVADTAGSIAAGDLQQRANLTQSSDEVGRLGRAFDTMVDRLQDALTTSNASEERMRRFLADASHELRTPLTVLRGMSEVLLRQGSRERTPFEDALRDMHLEAIRLSQLVDDLLTLTRLDSGLPLNPEPVHLRLFLEQFREHYAQAWPHRRLDLDSPAPHDGAAYVDPEALRRVVTNLVDNAARYSTAGTPITIAGLVEGETVVVSVRDEGPGLTAGDAEHVFERFYRGAKSRSRQSGGTGLGLAIVQALVAQSGGQVNIDTAPDRGTTVSVTLPRFQDWSGTTKTTESVRIAAGR